MVILITGASVGFGAASARKFVANGHKVILLARRLEKLEALQKELGGEENAQIIACDVCDTARIESALANLAQDFKQIDVLLNNAGLALGLQSADEANIADWEEMIQTNVLALVRLTRLLLPQMVARKKGHIINIGSIAGRYPYPGGNVYGATKAFVRQFSLNLRAPINALGPMVESIKEHYGISSATFGLLSAIPIVAFGSISFIVSYFSNIKIR